MYGMNKGVNRVRFGAERGVIKLAFFGVLVSSVGVGWVLVALAENLNCRIFLLRLDKSVCRAFIFAAWCLYGACVL